MEPTSWNGVFVLLMALLLIGFCIVVVPIAFYIFFRKAHEFFNSPTVGNPIIKPYDVRDSEWIKMHKTWMQTTPTGKQCPVCKDTYVGLFALSCGHYGFCCDCCIKIFEREPRCPCCRKMLIAYFPIYDISETIK